MGSLLSLDINKSKIHMAEGSYQKGTIVVEKVAAIEVPHGSFQGEIIISPETLAESLSPAIQGLGFRTKEAVVTYDAFGALVRDIDLPAAKPKELASMVRREMEQNYHAPSNQVIQYKFLEKIQNEQGAALDKYRVAAVDREIIEGYYQLLSALKLKPVAMDININAIGKLLEGDITINETQINEHSIMFIDFSETLTTVYIISKDKPVFFRQLDSGHCDIERLISNQKFEPEENIRRLKEEGFNFFGDQPEEESYFAILRPFFYSLMDEIRKIIGFYSSRSNKENITHIFLMGSGSYLKGFTEYCENNFGISCEQVISLSKVKSKDSTMPITSYLNAIGSLIRY